LLDTNEVKQLLEDGSMPLHIVRLPVKDSTFSRPRWFSRWFKST